LFTRNLGGYLLKRKTSKRVMDMNMPMKKDGVENAKKENVESEKKDGAENMTDDKIKGIL